MLFENLFLVVWSVVSFWNLGEIWICQIVIYPLFGKVPADGYTDYHTYYGKRIPPVIIAPGFAGFLLPLPLAFLGPEVPLWMTLSNIGFGLIGLAVTALLEIPRHLRLQKQRDEAVIHELIIFNWPRTASITAQSCVTFMMMLYVFV